MSEQEENNYPDGDIVWVKLGGCWWPGEVVSSEKLPPDVLRSFRKPPIAIVKFFQEDTYEFVKNLNCICKYECRRKNEFINKGLYLYRTKHGPMEKFPEDVIRAETAIGGDIKILTRDEFQEEKKESYAGLFGDPKKTPASSKGAKGRLLDSEKISTPIRKLKEKSNYKVHILLQGSKTPSNAESVSTPSTSRAGSEPSETTDKTENKAEESEKSITPAKPAFTTPTMSSGGTYACHACNFTTARLNVLILHNKTHSLSFMPYTPSPVRKKPVKPPKPAPVATKTPKQKKPRQEKSDKPKKTSSKKRPAEIDSIREIKKPKTDEEIKSSLLADWDDGDEESNEDSAMIMAESPEVPVAAESPAVPTPAELPSAQVPSDSDKKLDKSQDTEKPESSSDSKYEFCEDEDWPVETDVGRKIPRIKNHSKRKGDTKSISIDEEEMAREVAELLNKTTLPELPSAPQTLRVEENFPEPSIVKSPDKNPDPQDSVEQKSSNDLQIQPPKTIFKTKTFFRSRHSRSQDAIGKYVAEQLNAAERLDINDSDINGSEIPMPEMSVSPPIEHIKVPRLAPKIQLKKMKAEAAQLRESEKYNEQKREEFPTTYTSYATENIPIDLPDPIYEQRNTDIPEKSQINLPDTISGNHKTDAPEKIQIDLLDPISEKHKADIPEKLHIELPDTISGKHKTEITEKLQIDLPDPINEKQETDISEKLHIDLPDPTTDKRNTEIPEELQIDLSEPISEKQNSVNLLEQDLPLNENSEHVNDDENIDVIEKTVNLSKNEVLKDIPYDENNLNKSDIAYENDFYRHNENVETENNDVSSHLENIEPILSENEPAKSYESYMNESTASAVDALLSVSREADRVTKVISDDPPEDLFEDDLKDSISNNLNGYNNTDHQNYGLDNKEPLYNDNSDDKIRVVKDINITNKDSETSELFTKFVTVETSSHETGLVKDDHAKEDVEEQDTQKVFLNEVPPIDSGQIKEIDKSEIIAKETVSIENTLSESDLQIAEALINLPTTTLQNKVAINHNPDINALAHQEPEEVLEYGKDLVVAENNEVLVEEINPNTTSDSPMECNNEIISSRFETEQEKSENLNAAQSLVQMSETIDHKLKIPDFELPSNIVPSKANEIKIINTDVKIKSIIKPVDCISELSTQLKTPVELETKSPKLLKILEEPCLPKLTPKRPITKQIIVPGKETILNIDVGKSTIKPKVQSQKQKIIIRRTATTPGKNLLNNISEVSTPDKIILSRSNKPGQDGSSVQTYTIQTAPETVKDTNTIVIQQKLRKMTKPVTKIQKIKPQPQISPLAEAKAIKDTKSKGDAIFDINSMPIVLSDDILTPESIEKMPIVMSDGNVITNPSNPPKLVKSKQIVVEKEKLPISAISNKTLLMNSNNEVSKVTTPNILSKSSKLRGGKSMLVLDKTVGKQKIIITKSEAVGKEIKQPPTLIQSISQTTPKTEKFIILPTQSSPRAGRTQKIVIDPQTGKAHVLVGKGPEAPSTVAENKPVSAKLIPSASDASTPGNTVMIITNAQGTQSRIVLTPEHEKILFPNKQQPNVSQLKAITHRITSSPGTVQKTIVSTATPAKTQTRIVPKQKSAIITSQGQLLVGGRIATTAQNIAPMPEIRPAPKRIIASEPKKLVQAIQKNSAEPLIFLQQKSGTVMQLTAAQFEHLQRTGQIIQKPATPQQKIVMQKSITLSSNESTVPTIQKQRIRKQPSEQPTPSKRVKHEIAIAPAPTPIPMPALASITSIAPPQVPNVSSTTNNTLVANYADLENFEELLPSTAIAKQEAALAQPEPTNSIQDGHLLAVPGEHFGGPTGSFYLCVEENGTFTVIDNRPLVLENNQLVPMAEPLPVLTPQPERRDILEAALANSDVFHAEPRDEAPDFRDLNANVSVHCRVSETSTTLNQPIMTPVEVPTKADTEPAVATNIEDGLAVIGVTPHTVPTSLELPITVTDPRIAPKTTNPLTNNNYGAPLLPSPSEMSFATEEPVGPISMPILTEDSVGKSMPILTEEVNERTVSSVESTIGSPSSNEDSGQWPRSLLTPCSDTSETSAEIPLQPVMQLSVADLSHSS